VTVRGRAYCRHENQLAMVLAAIGCAVTAQAAEKIRYGEMSSRLALFGYLIKDRCVNVKSLSGAKHPGTRLYLLPIGALVLREDGSSEFIPGEEIARIEIKPCGGSFFGVTLRYALIALDPKILCGDHHGRCVAASYALLSPETLAFAVASAPFTLAVDGVTFLIPPKVYEIVH
jgi:hypothetical protein